ncbi:hypothetical protein AVEN_9991-1 [Araneus ventricosus]|uniref:Endonuclease/exonuclease/phosphatase domain-containing protein n=1 Tax=Araneus ventricosus TaxID=182803 RepID=A0A4Y2PUA3_ARAVE|nr:hypothetical protein AVEN_9991-1 [Araneus ventricosus]
MYWNADGIRSSAEELGLFVNKHSLVVLLLQETHLRPQKIYFLACYQIFNSCKENLDPFYTSGGTVVSIKSSMPRCNIIPPTLMYVEISLVIITPKDHNPITLTSICTPMAFSSMFTFDLENLLQISKNQLENVKTKVLEHQRQNNDALIDDFLSLDSEAETSETITELDILESVKNKNNIAINCDEDDVDGNVYDAEINKPSYDEMLKSFETMRLKGLLVHSKDARRIMRENTF